MPDPLYEAALADAGTVVGWAGMPIAWIGPVLALGLANVFAIVLSNPGGDADGGAPGGIGETAVDLGDTAVDIGDAKAEGPPTVPGPLWRGSANGSKLGGIFGAARATSGSGSAARAGCN